MSETFDCLACGRKNPKRYGSYTNTYCNNKCQQTHRKQLLKETRLTEWLDGCGLYVWKEIPEYVREYLIQQRGHQCETCGNTEWMYNPIPLEVTQINGDIYNNKQENLELICPNCKAQK
jgi:ssDNA-binding Zn-finger/Zn-ribbon topoisomerase 1